MTNKHYFLLLLALSFSTIFTVFTITGTDTSISKLVWSYKIGDKASDFRLKNVDGSMVSMKDYPEASGFILVFTCNTCPYSVANEDRIIALDKKYRDRGYPVIAVNPNNPASSPGDSFEQMKIRAEEKGFTFPYLLDEGQKVYPEYGASRTPHVYVLHKENKDLVVKYIGSIDDSPRNPGTVKTKYVENAVDALLIGQEVPLQETKAIGCSIKK